ncbi:MAG: cobyrinate a,c-diamide synthase [Massilibacteroides sp.]|nr:cobyrinate a,c-diamide synthase [Massilibacteroides sp.]MDD3061426.1 cobyrinate a,c-diamide synthase [Massilibacteroides sp.]MDD4116173.1 cobyrinate a,c-diamide synthase [Massilibacteroides sp.]
MKEISSFLIAAPFSGSGKTTVVLGLLQAFKNRGYHMQPFKCGPDYIDVKYHDLASGNRSVNLDLFLSSERHVKDIYTKYAFQNDISIVEGVMGLYDGYDGSKGSSAEIAKRLKIPVILVVNAKSTAYSVAPLLYGFKNFDKEVNIIGVIFNFVGSANHYDLLKQACNDIGIKSFGYLPKDKEIEIPSRHLGLSLEKEYMFGQFANKAASLIEKYVYLDDLLDATRTYIDKLVLPSSPLLPYQMKIAIALDDAFNFTYHANIEYLKQRGEISFFSPLKDSCLPETDFVYFPGGYPELFFEQLSKNNKLHKSIRDYVDKGGRILAECGGMMYLSSSITDKYGQEYPMVGIFPQRASMKDMKLNLGYRIFTYNGLTIKGHEFHYSQTDSNWDSVVQIYNAKNRPVDTKLLRYKNTIAGYTHWYWAEMDNLFDVFN